MSYTPFNNIEFQTGAVTVNTGTSGTVVNTQPWGGDTLNVTRHAITFPVAFSSAPIVVPSFSGNTGGHSTDTSVWVEAGSVTTTGCNLLVACQSNSANITLNWIATVGQANVNSSLFIASGQRTGINTSSNIQSTSTYNGVATNTGQYLTIFAVTFPRPPIVLVGMEGNDAGHSAALNCYVEFGSVTSTGFNILISDFTSSNNINVNWIAIA